MSRPTAGDDPSLENLLELDGMRLVLNGEGYWVKIDAVRVPPSPERPYGIGYTLTLHAPDGGRLLGYDNAHPVRLGRGPGAAKPTVHDHRHRGEAVGPYQYRSAADLLVDFWGDVDAVLSERGVR
ncbi:MAG TPA: DUF6516 family protein [Azospirillaceae bacterium]|nr:DUF6516 family protein [Azospirillaceae bacterium]